MTPKRMGTGIFFLGGEKQQGVLLSYESTGPNPCAERVVYYLGD